jgi:hypothetical protein
MACTWPWDPAFCDEGLHTVYSVRTQVHCFPRASYFSPVTSLIYIHKCTCMSRKTGWSEVCKSAWLKCCRIPPKYSSCESESWVWVWVWVSSSKHHVTTDRCDQCAFKHTRCWPHPGPCLVYPHDVLHTASIMTWSHALGVFQMSE